MCRIGGLLPIFVILMAIAGPCSKSPVAPSFQAGTLNVLWGDGNWCVRNVRDVSHPSVFIRRCQYWQRRMNTLGKRRDCHAGDVANSQHWPLDSVRHHLLPIRDKVSLLAL